MPDIRRRSVQSQRIGWTISVNQINICVKQIFWWNKKDFSCIFCVQICLVTNRFHMNNLNIFHIPNRFIYRVMLSQHHWNDIWHCFRDMIQAINSYYHANRDKIYMVCLCFLLVQTIRLGKEPVTTTREQIIRAKKLYESAFHPDSGELQNIFGRMSFQVPGGMILTGAMLQFYRTVPQIVISQWANQSFSKWFWSVWKMGVYVSGRFYIFLYPQNFSRCVGQLHKSKC